MSYAAAIDQLSALMPELYTQPGQARRKFSLAEIGTLLAALGDPHRRFRSVLIAGTNGKGSTAATLASICTASGIRTGLYTSPHLTRPNERIRVNGAEIADDDFARLYFRVHDCGQQLVLDNQLAQLPSFFETLTAMAFLRFAEAAIDIAVLEVGMGGRLDATNIVDPLLSIVTDISLDHTEWLGSTISAIAREKAGILRPKGTLITLPQHPEANQVLGEAAMELGVRAINAVSYMPQSAHSIHGAKNGASVTATGSYVIDVLDATVEVTSTLQGEHQHRNVALAISAAVELAANHGLPIGADSIERGIRFTCWPGRFECVSTPVEGLASPQVAQWILDVAHNPAGAWALRAALRRHFRLGEPGAPHATLIFSCLRDKPLAEIAQILFPLFDEVIFAPIHSVRATPTADLVAAAGAVGIPARTATSIEDALGFAESIPIRVDRHEAPFARLVAVAGSVYLVGEIRPLLLARTASKPVAAQP
jgi:dihydrofolate synthase/folylpolyglutamate synthase